MGQLIPGLEILGLRRHDATQVRLRLGRPPHGEQPDREPQFALDGFPVDRVGPAQQVHGLGRPALLQSEQPGEMEDIKLLRRRDPELAVNSLSLHQPSRPVMGRGGLKQGLQLGGRHGA